MMDERQRELFDDRGFAPSPAAAQVTTPLIAAADLDDNALIAAIPYAGRLHCHELTAEAVRRNLTAAIPALEALCRRFKGFGLQHPVPEQIAAIEAMAAIGGTQAADVVASMIIDSVVQGPGLAAAVRAAASLRCRLPSVIAVGLLRHADPAIRADAARCTHSCTHISTEVITVLLDLLEDLNSAVAVAAALTLGRWGRAEARPMLLGLLQREPSAEVIEAIVPVSDESCAVMLGRIAATIRN